MRRPLLTFAVMLLAGAAVFLTGQRLAIHWCARQMARPSDDLAWLRLEFRLNDTELARARQLHEGYLPKCHEFCARIDLSKRELQAMLASGANAPAAIEQKLVEIGTLRAQCQAAMLQHFREVSQIMPPEQGRRYLAEMQRLTLGFHEQIERAMSSGTPSPHGTH
ncbi:MAG: periplasmic heavy metal sensor [Verrucomicrobia bacterium]|nr:periplasmic heavy metal sensor [Verrucomicrobiota bacterium]